MEVMNTDRFISEKSRATVEPKRWIFPVVAVCLLLAGMSVVVWSAWELHRLEYLSRPCDQIVIARSGLDVNRECVVQLAWYRTLLERGFPLVGIVGSSIGIGLLLPLVFFRFRMPIDRTPA